MREIAASELCQVLLLLQPSSVSLTHSHSRTCGPRAEFDMPGHGAWYHGHPELNLSSCSDVLDPTNDAVFTFLLSFLGEITEIFSDEWLFLGGDEVGFDPKCKWPGAEVCG